MASPTLHPIHLHVGAHLGDLAAQVWCMLLGLFSLPPQLYGIDYIDVLARLDIPQYLSRHAFQRIAAHPIQSGKLESNQPE